MAPQKVMAVTKRSVQPKKPTVKALAKRVRKLENSEEVKNIHTASSGYFNCFQQFSDISLVAFPLNRIAEGTNDGERVGSVCKMISMYFQLTIQRDNSNVNQGNAVRYAIVLVKDRTQSPTPNVAPQLEDIYKDIDTQQRWILAPREQTTAANYKVLATGTYSLNRASSDQFIIKKHIKLSNKMLRFPETVPPTDYPNRNQIWLYVGSDQPTGSFPPGFNFTSRLSYTDA